MPMKSREEIVELLRRARPELEREFGITRLAVFGSRVRGDATERSDVDVLVDFDPKLGLRFVDLAEQIEALLGVRTDVISRRAIPRSTGPRSKASWKMSRRPVRRLLEDMLERIGRVERYVTGLDRAAFLRDDKTSDSVVRNLEVLGEAANRPPGVPPTACRGPLEPDHRAPPPRRASLL